MAGEGVGRAVLSELDASAHVAAAATGRRRTPWWLALIVTVVIFVLGAILSRVTINLPENPTALQTALFFVPTLVVAYGIRVLLVWLWVGRYERRSFRSLGFPRGGGLLLLRGVGVGLLVSGAIVGLIAAFGGVTLRPADPASTGTAALAGSLVMLVGWAVQSSTEEIMYRGFVLQSFARYRAWIGVVVSALVFLLVHEAALSNPLAAFNIFLAGVMFGVYVLREGGLWGACGLHLIFNWSQNSLYGFAVSGQEIRGGSLLALQTTGDPLLTGGEFGIEAGWAGTVVLLAVIVVLVLLRNRREAGRPTGESAAGDTMSRGGQA